MSTETTNSSKKFEEALHLLNEAAREKKDEIGSLLSDKYTHIRGVIEDAAAKNAEKFDRFRQMAGTAFQDGGEKLKEVASDVDERVKQNPWPYIGGVAVGALLLGYILGASKRN